MFAQSSPVITCAPPHRPPPRPGRADADTRDPRFQVSGPRGRAGEERGERLEHGEHGAAEVAEEGGVEAAEDVGRDHGVHGVNDADDDDGADEGGDGGVEGRDDGPARLRTRKDEAEKKSFGFP